MEWVIATAVVIAAVCVVGWFVREDIRKARESELRRDQRYQEALLRQLNTRAEKVGD